MKLPPRPAAPAARPTFSRKETDLDEIRAAGRRAYQFTFALVSLAATVVVACVLAELVD